MKLVLLILLGVLSSSLGHHILCVFPVPAVSHHQLGKAIVESLLQGGHTVTWITPYPGDSKTAPSTLKYIDASNVIEISKAYDLMDPKNAEKRHGIEFVREFARNIITNVMSIPAVVDAVTKTQYDAVITEKFFTDAEAGIAAIQQVPWLVYASAVQINPVLEDMMDEVRSVNTVPLVFNNCPVPMGFWDRVINLMITTMMTLDIWKDKAESTKLYNSIFTPLAAARGVTLPPFSSALHNVSVLFVNTHESLAPAFSVPPNVVNVAGFHMDKEIPPLPKDLQELLDNSPQGVIYFSFGSIVRSAELSAETRKELLQVFSKLPHTVLWKFEEEMTGDVPKNVHVRKWFPQLSILAHPNTRAFISHGGQLSVLEAAALGVPLIALPIFGDQQLNAAKAVSNGFAIKATFGPNMATEIEIKLKELLENDQYTKRAKFVSKLFNSRPVHPAVLIRHYTELAIETKGAYHLRSLSLQYSWYELWMLDVAAAALALLTVTLGTLLLALRWCIRKCSGKSKASTSYKQKKNK